MKKIIPIAVLALATSYASATVYNDTTGEIIAASHIDIVSVEIMNDLTDITFSITTVGDIVVADWGNFMVGIDSVGAAGDSTGVGWVPRPMSFSADPIDYWIGGWTDSGSGSEVYDYNDGTVSWDGPVAPGHSIVGNNFTFTVPLADLGLSPSDTFSFDVLSSGSANGDGAIDSLANPAQSIANWGDAYDASTVSPLLTYTVVPEPATLSLLALGGVALAFVRRRRA